MESSIISLVGIICAFLVFISVVIILVKKNVFHNSHDSNRSQKKNISNNQEADLSKILDENSRLKAKLAFLETKNSKLEEKIKDLKNINVTLEEQKEQLIKNEQTLAELKTQKDDLLTMVVHDIKNPASTIKSFVELLESYDLNAQEQQDVMSGLLETSTQILKLAEEFSYIVEQEHVVFKLNLERHNMNDAVESIIKSNRISAKNKDIVIDVKKSYSIPEVEMDYIKIKEVLDNFVGNALKYSPPRSRVLVETKLADNCVAVEIQDYGYGLTQAEIAKAFDRGAKFQTNPEGNESSTGLGLWIAKRIVEEHKGRVWIKSTKGKGSTFGFNIPIK